MLLNEKSKILFASSIAHMHNHMAINFIIAILPVFQAILMLNYTQTELIVATFFLSYSTSTFLSGMIGLKHSRKMIVVSGQLLSVLALILMIFSNNYVFLLMVQVLFGFGCGTYHPPGTAILVDSAPNNRINTFLGIHGFGSSIGMILSPLAVSIFLVSMGVSKLILFFALFTLLIAIIYFTFVQDVVRGKSSLNVLEFLAYFKKSKNYSFLTSYLLRDASFYGIMAFIPIYAFNVVGLSAAESAATVAIFPFLGLVGNLAGGALGDKYGPKWVAMSCIMLSALVLFITYLAPTKLMFFAAIICLGILIYMTIPLYDALVALALPKEFRTPAYGIFIGVGALFGGLFSLWAGVISDHVSPNHFYFFLTVALMLAGILIRRVQLME